MHLESFRIRNFRSINDSGEITASRITALLGRNESGKSNLLRALHSLNPVDGFVALNPIKDFPRHRRLEECNDSTDVVSSKWKLSPDEQAELQKIIPRAKDVTHVTIDRKYRGKSRYIQLLGLGNISLNETETASKIKKVGAAVRAAAQKLESSHSQPLNSAADEFEQAAAPIGDIQKWAENAAPAFQTLRTAIATADAEITEKQEALLIELEALASSISTDEDAQSKACSWVLSAMPKFIYIDEYPELSGHQNIAEYITRKNKGMLNDSDHQFEKLCKVAGLNPEKLNELLSQNDPETRNQLVNRASAVVTNEIKRLWKDRALKIRFNLDANHLDTFISDPTATYDVEVNLNERSRGFQWFFAFYITFSADTNGGDAENSVILLDEPGLYLHAKSQSDLLRHFESDFSNQILYSTHSPFMVPTHSLDSIRTVNIGETTGTTVTNDPSGDSRTLFPLQAALGYDLAQSLFVGPNNLVVEGVTDFWILSSVSEYLADSGRTGLAQTLTLTPAGGAQKVSYMVALLSSEQLNVLVLLDEEKDSRSTRDELIKSKLINEKNVIFVTESFGASPPNEADIEDILDGAVYENLVRESYAKELKGKTLKLNNHIPRIAKRVEAGLAELGIEFHKTRPTRLLLSKMAADAASVITADTAARFEALFKAINERLDKHVAKGGTAL